MSLEMSEKKERKVVWSEAELEAARLPTKLSVSEFADKYRQLDVRTSANPGRWKTSFCEYQRQVMDELCNPKTTEITLCCAAQIGKSEILISNIIFCMVESPGPALLVLPTQNDSLSFSKTRIRPLFDLMPILKKEVKDKVSSMSNLQYDLKRMSLKLAWPSPSRLSSTAIKYLFIDETDKIDPNTSKIEGDPISLAKERTKNFRDSKIIKCSTPTTEHGYINESFESSRKHYFFVPCPHCEHFQRLIMAQIKWDKEESIAKMKETRNVHYECINCKRKLTDREKNSMVKRGHWRVDGESLNNPESHKGYQISSIYSPWITLTDVACEFRQSKGHIARFQNFLNSWLGEPFKQKSEVKDVNNLRQKVIDYHEGEVPSQVLYLTCGVDVQKYSLYFSIRGWGKNEESWLILAKQVQDFKALEHYVFETEYLFKGSKDRGLTVQLTMIDSAYRQDEVFEFVSKHRDRAKAIRGNRFRTGNPIRSSKIDLNIFSGRAIERGMRVFSINSEFFKDKMARLSSDTTDLWHLPIEASEEYMRQFCAEEKVHKVNRRTGVSEEKWQLVQGEVDNHYFDTETYGVCASHMLLSMGVGHTMYGKKVPSRARKRREVEWLADIPKGYLDR